MVCSSNIILHENSFKETDQKGSQMTKKSFNTIYYHDGKGQKALFVAAVITKPFHIEKQNGYYEV